MTDYALVLHKMHNGKEWVVYGNDYDTMQWFSDTPKPTQKSLDDAWPDVQAEIAQAATDAAAARASGLAKLAGLGLTPDEIAALVGQ